MLKTLLTLLTLIRINYHLFWTHPDKVLRLSRTIDSARYYAIYDRDNNERVTLRFQIDAWQEMTNRKINQMLRVNI